MHIMHQKWQFVYTGLQIITYFVLRRLKIAFMDLEMLKTNMIIKTIDWLVPKKMRVSRFVCMSIQYTRNLHHCSHFTHFH